MYVDLRFFFYEESFDQISKIVKFIILMQCYSFDKVELECSYLFRLDLIL